VLEFGVRSSAFGVSEFGVRSSECRRWQRVIADPADPAYSADSADSADPADPADTAVETTITATGTKKGVLRIWVIYCFEIN
jgi:hypothetical protein